MSIKSDLKKDGIEVIKQLDTLKTNSIAQHISEKLCGTFPELHFNQNDLFMRLSRLNMYIAKIPEGMAEATYFYKNSSIYFNEHIPEENLEKFAIHECIHYLQEVKDNKNYLIRMGLCDYTEFKIYGLGLNEAAVQLMTSKILGTKKDFVKYYGISFEAVSPSYYPLECALVNQLAYITGEDVLFDSTINSNNNFKSKLISLMGEREFFEIQNSLDIILNCEEKITKINNKIVQIDDRNKKVDNLIAKINDLKKNIETEFINTQNNIIASYFDKEFQRSDTLEGLENFRRKLYCFKDYIGANNEYTFFNDYYVDKMMQIEEKSNLIQNNQYVPETNIQLPKRYSKIWAIIGFFKNLFNLNKSKSYDNNNNL